MLSKDGIPCETQLQFTPKSWTIFSSSIIYYISKIIPRENSTPNRANYHLYQSETEIKQVGFPIGSEGRSNPWTWCSMHRLHILWIREYVNQLNDWLSTLLLGDDWLLVL